MAQSSIVSTDTKLTFGFLRQGFDTIKTIDIAQCLSVVNRRFYRQGMNYAVSSIEAFSANSGARVAIATLPTTWVADNATTRAYIAWNAQRKEVLDEQPSMKAKWSDFKIHMDSQHVSDGFLGNMVPIDSASNLYALGEWTASEMVFPVTGGSGGTGAANQQTMHVVGDNIPAGNFTVTKTSFSLIEAYANSRRTEQNPDPSTTGVSTTTNPYATLSIPDSLFQDVAENLLDNNDLAPYVMDDYPGGEVQAPVLQYFDDLRLNNFGDASQFSSDQSGPLVVPFGLLRLQFSNTQEDDAITIVVNCVPGSYKGVLAERGV